MAADQASDGGVVGQDADDVATPLDLLVQSLQSVGGGNLRPVLLRESHKRQDVLLGAVHAAGGFGEALTQAAGCLPPLALGRRLIRLGKGGTHRRRDRG